MEKSNQLIALVADVGEFQSGVRAPEQQPHYSPDVQHASHPSSHSFTTHAVFNTYSPMHYDGDVGDIPFSPTKEGDEPPMQYDGDVRDIPFSSPNEIDQPQIQKMQNPGWMLMEWKINHAAK